MEWLSELLGQVDDGIMSYVTMVIRFLLPALALVVIVRCLGSLIRGKGDNEDWGYLSLPNGARIYLKHWENVIGRAESSDIYMEYPTLSRSHAAVIRDDKGNWRAFDVTSKTGAAVNGVKIESEAGLQIKTGDILSLGGLDLVFVSGGNERGPGHMPSGAQTINPANQRNTLFFLAEFQLLLGLQLCISKGDGLTAVLPLAFVSLIALTWLCYILTRALGRTAFEVETLAFFLSSLGLGVAAAGSPEDLFRALGLLLAGLFTFFGVGWMLRDLDAAKKLRLPVAVAGLLLLGSNMLFSRSIYGARRWLEIGGISFQPSEFVKIALIFAGAATLDRLFARKHLLTFIAFAGACVLALAFINDFGSALIFFVAYLVIAYLRSGDMATIFLSVGGAGFAGLLAIQFRSHIAARFSTWGDAWGFADGRGYQQTRAMSAAASGGLFGVGAGNGWFHTVFAADSDLVFAMVSEELGLIIALASVAVLVVFVVFSVRSAGSSRSSFYLIGACAASSILLFQGLLNVLGSMDILPFTGVTFPFVSRGGSSLMACWGLLAFMKAADNRDSV